MSDTPADQPAKGASPPPAAEQDTRLPAPKTWDEYFEGVTSWLDERWDEGPECPQCQHPEHNWGVSSAAALFSAPGWPTSGGRAGVAPMVPLTCANCGYTVFYSALVIFQPQHTKPVVDEGGKS